MIFSLHINNGNYQIETDEPIDISIPLNFNGAQPNAYGVEKAQSKPCKAGELVGDTRRGGSCNFEQVKFIPHCNGTHTECVGHITNERIDIRDCLKDVFIPAALISVKPDNALESGETYAVELSEKDKLITRKAIEKVLQQAEAHALARAESSTQDFPPLLTRGLPLADSFVAECALIVRTLPNDESKLAQTYLENIPPFFSTEAMKFIAEIGVKHLLVDMPSIDRIFDEGKLSNHRIFWNVQQGAFEINEKSLIQNTITELIYVPNEIADGDYLLNLQIAPFASDASPSRPILFNILELNQS